MRIECHKFIVTNILETHFVHVIKILLGMYSKLIVYIHWLDTQIQ